MYLSLMITREQEFAERFAKASDEKIIKMFNHEVGNTAWGNARADCLHAMRNEFLRRDLESDLVITKNTSSLARKIKQVNGKIFYEPK